MATGNQPASRPDSTAATLDASSSIDVQGTWNLTVRSPMGPMSAVLVIERRGDSWVGSQSGQGMSEPITEAKLDGSRLSWVNQVRKPMKLKLQCSGLIDGHSISGTMKAGFVGTYVFTGTKAS